MNSQIILKTKIERPREMTKQEAAGKDKEQPWRKKIPSAAMDDFTALMSMLYWIRDIAEKPQMIKLLREMRVYSRTKSGLALLFRACTLAFHQISAVQLRAMDANWQERYMTISASRNVQGFVNVDSDALDTILSQVILRCQDEMCMADLKAAEKCPVKQALDVCPNLGRFCRDRESFADVCPYSIMEVDEAP